MFNNSIDKMCVCMWKWFLLEFQLLTKNGFVYPKKGYVQAWENCKDLLGLNLDGCFTTEILKRQTTVKAQTYLKGALVEGMFY